MNNLPILIDTDGVLCDFINPFLAMANEITGLSKTVHDLTTWDMLPMYPQEQHQAILDSLVKPGWCLGLQPIEGAREAVEALRKIRKVYCATAPWTSETWGWERTTWLEKHMGFHRHDVVQIHDKWIIPGLTLIDDKVETLVKWQKAWGGIGILITQPYNRSFDVFGTGIWRADSWKDVLDYVKALAHDDVIRAYDAGKASTSPTV